MGYAVHTPIIPSSWIGTGSIGRGTCMGVCGEREAPVHMHGGPFIFIFIFFVVWELLRKDPRGPDGTPTEPFPFSRCVPPPSHIDAVNKVGNGLLIGWCGGK